MPKQSLIYFAVTLEQGENWDNKLSMREQKHWNEHAKLMDAFVDDGFIVLGGPLDNEEKVLLIFNAESRETIETRMANDPWISKGVRRIAKVEQWKILLDARR